MRASACTTAEHTASQTFVQGLRQIPDPRQRRGQRYTWETLLLVICAALLSGQQTGAAIAQWVAEHAAEWQAWTPTTAGRGAQRGDGAAGAAAGGCAPAGTGAGRLGRRAAGCGTDGACGPYGATTARAGAGRQGGPWRPDAWRYGPSGEFGDAHRCADAGAMRGGGEKQ